jgi:hypothetical protein
MGITVHAGASRPPKPPSSSSAPSRPMATSTPYHL